jgi:hypothetical protein
MLGRVTLTLISYTREELDWRERCPQDAVADHSRLGRIPKRPALVSRGCYSFLVPVVLG